MLSLVGGVLGLAVLALGDSISCSLDRTAVIIATGQLPPPPQPGESDPGGNAYGHNKRC